MEAVYNNYLIHHGIKGQKWGVRRFQNTDGSLTSAGRNRYGVEGTREGSSSSKSGIDKEKAKKIAKTVAIGVGAAAIVAATALVANNVYKNVTLVNATKTKAFNDMMREGELYVQTNQNKIDRIKYFNDNDFPVDKAKGEARIAELKKDSDNAMVDYRTKAYQMKSNYNKAKDYEDTVNRKDYSENLRKKYDKQYGDWKDDFFFDKTKAGSKQVTSKDDTEVKSLKIPSSVHVNSENTKKTKTFIDGRGHVRTIAF